MSVMPPPHDHSWLKPTYPIFFDDEGDYSRESKEECFKRAMLEYLNMLIKLYNGEIVLNKTYGYESHIKLNDRGYIETVKEKPEQDTL